MGGRVGVVIKRRCSKRFVFQSLYDHAWHCGLLSFLSLSKMFQQQYSEAHSDWVFYLIKEEFVLEFVRCFGCRRCNFFGRFYSAIELSNFLFFLFFKFIHEQIIHNTEILEKLEINPACLISFSFHLLHFITFLFGVVLFENFFPEISVLFSVRLTFLECHFFYLWM